MPYYKTFEVKKQEPFSRAIMIKKELIKIIKNNKKSSRFNQTREEYPHFRHYKKSGHPALILSEENEDKYNFRRVTSAEFSGHHRNEKIEPNPDKRRNTPMYIVKQRQKDLKKNFSKWKYPWKYPKK